MNLTKNDAIRKVLNLDPDEDAAEEIEALLSVYAFMADYAMFPGEVRNAPLNKAELTGMVTLRTIIAALQEQ
jgi:hypothetical protein